MTNNTNRYAGGAILLDLLGDIKISAKYVAGTNYGEYECTCPFCGGNDRFRVWPYLPQDKCIGRYWCRQCEESGDSIEFCRQRLGKSFDEAVEHVNGFKPNASSATRVAIKKDRLVEPPAKWLESALGFVRQAHAQIFNYPDIVQLLEKRGITKRAILKNKIGYCNQDLYFDKNRWGLESNLSNTKKIWLPAGIVIPTIEPSGTVTRIKIRRIAWQQNDESQKYVNVSNNMAILSVYGNKNNKVLVFVESELDAIAIEESVGDFATAIALGSNLNNPDDVTDFLAQQAENLLICYDNDRPGLLMFKKLKSYYPRSVGYPVPKDLGKDIGEAIQQGLDLKSWLLDALPSVYKQKYAIKSSVPVTPSPVIEVPDEPTIESTMIANDLIVDMPITNTIQQSDSPINDSHPSSLPIETESQQIIKTQQAVCTTNTVVNVQQVDAPCQDTQPVRETKKYDQENIVKKRAAYQFDFTWTEEDSLDVKWAVAGNKFPRPKL